MTNEALLKRVEKQLEEWALEARTGGWSTQHVDPMIKLSWEIKRHVHNCKFGKTTIETESTEKES